MKMLSVSIIGVIALASVARGSAAAHQALHGKSGGMMEINGDVVLLLWQDSQGQNFHHLFEVIQGVDAFGRSESRVVHTRQISDDGRRVLEDDNRVVFRCMGKRWYVDSWWENATGERLDKCRNYNFVSVRRQRTGMN